MFTQIRAYCDSLIQQFNSIPQERKSLLEKLSKYIIQKKSDGEAVNLVYICTHNSRRSHLGQIWAQVAAKYYGIKDVHTFSGGTEATAFNINAINAIKRIGFEVKAISLQENPTYQVIFDESESPVICFSKVYDDPKNPREESAAIMTCSEAEENCPLIPGVELRIGITYEDPKRFDDTLQQDAKYDERCKQIALETLYAFSKIK